jgi:hypothetical protein
MAERFFRATALAGELHLIDLSDWDDWELGKIQYRDEAARDSPASYLAGPPTDPDVRISRIRLFKTTPLRTSKGPLCHVRSRKWVPPEEIVILRPRETPTL